MYTILNTKIMDEYIQDKWMGRMGINASIFDYSTSYQLFINRHGLFYGDKLYKQLK